MCKRHFSLLLLAWLLLQERYWMELRELYRVWLCLFHSKTPCYGPLYNFRAGAICGHAYRGMLRYHLLCKLKSKLAERDFAGSHLVFNGDGNDLDRYTVQAVDYVWNFNGITISLWTGCEEGAKSFTPNPNLMNILLILFTSLFPSERISTEIIIQYYSSTLRCCI